MRILESAATIEEAHKRFVEAFERRAERSGRQKIGFQGGAKEATGLHVPALDLWLAHERLEKYHWNALGTGDLFGRPTPAIVVEINPPYSGRTARVAGVFLRDDDGSLWLGHRGRLGGGRPGIGGAFKDAHPHRRLVIDGEGQAEVIVIGAIERPDFLDRVADFVRSVSEFKAAAAGRTRSEQAQASQDAPGPAGRAKDGVGERPSQRAPIILVENERTAGGAYDHWQDATGERYQFPNSYRNKIVTGRRFVYYRGARRADGSRGEPEYFGHGIIGPVHRDPETTESEPKGRWKWFCDIDVYEPFPHPVPFRNGDSYIEQIPQNLWGVVRELPEEHYALILDRASVPAVDSSLAPVDAALDPRLLDGGGLLVPRTRGANAGAGASGGGPRRSRESKAVGDQGEKAVFEWLRKHLPSHEAGTLVHDAQEGSTPGYDMSYKSEGETVGVEVKATRGSAFPSIEITANEWQAAQRLGARFRLALVAQAMTNRPTISFIDNPARSVEEGILGIETSVHRITKRSDAGPGRD